MPEFPLFYRGELLFCSDGKLRTNCCKEYEDWHDSDEHDDWLPDDEEEPCVYPPKQEWNIGTACFCANCNGPTNVPYDIKIDGNTRCNEGCGAVLDAWWPRNFVLSLKAPESAPLSYSISVEGEEWGVSGTASMVKGEITEVTEKIPSGTEDIFQTPRGWVYVKTNLSFEYLGKSYEREITTPHFCYKISWPDKAAPREVIVYPNLCFVGQLCIHRTDMGEDGMSDKFTLMFETLAYPFDYEATAREVAYYSAYSAIIKLVAETCICRSCWDFRDEGFWQQEIDDPKEFVKLGSQYITDVDTTAHQYGVPGPCDDAYRIIKYMVDCSELWTVQYRLVDGTGVESPPAWSNVSNDITMITIPPCYYMEERVDTNYELGVVHVWWTEENPQEEFGCQVSEETWMTVPGASEALGVHWLGGIR